MWNLEFGRMSIFLFFLQSFHSHSNLHFFSLSILHTYIYESQSQIAIVRIIFV